MFDTFLSEVKTDSLKRYTEKSELKWRKRSWKFLPFNQIEKKSNWNVSGKLSICNLHPK